jgi:iron complex outermembrane recepter protein
MFKCSKGGLLPCAARALMAAGFCLTAGVVHAQQERAAQAGLIEIHLLAQPLRQALQALADAMGVQLAYDPADVDPHAVSPPLSGSYSVDQAFTQLLAKSGLAHHFINAHTVAIGRPRSGQRQPAGPNQMPPSAHLAYADTDGTHDASLDLERSDSVSDNPSTSERKRNASQLEEVIVTGTNIRGATTSASPIRTYSRSDIERSGRGTVAQFVQTLPQNYNVGGAFDTTNISVQEGQANNVVSAVGVNLRGLGNDATITMVNGRRLAPGNLDGNIVDISMIPLSAVDRIDVMTDGASAIYGSDAVGGVVNIIMRKNYDGIETRARYGGAQGTREVQVGQTLGHTWTGGSGLVSYEYYDHTPLSADERAFTNTARLPFTLLPENTRNSVWGSIDQALNPSISLFANGAYSHRSTYYDFSRTGLSNRVYTKIDSYSGVGGADITLSDTTDLSLSTNYSESKANQLDSSLLTGLTTDNVQASTKLLSVDALVRGALWNLPAGSISYAVGGQYRKESFDSLDTVSKKAFRPTRNVAAVFAEIRVPVIPGIHKLELSAAERLEHYSDFGSTNNPQFGITWKALTDLALRATYGRSFVAPLLSQLNPLPSQVIAYNTSLFAGAAPPGGNVSALIQAGGNPDLGPQTAKTWTAGFDWKPEAAPGTFASITYYGTRFTDRIGNLFSSGFSPAFALTQTQVLGPQIVQFNPPSSLVQSLLSVPNLLKFPGVDLSKIAAVVHGENLNLSSVNTDGLDATLAYRRALSPIELELGAAGTYILRYDTRFTTSSPTKELVNTQYNPPRFKMRDFIAVVYGHVTGGVFLNYVNGYQNTITTPSTRVASWTTIDVTATYACPTCEGPLSHLKAAFSVLNVGNIDPPYVKNGGGTFPINFDGANANPVGRYLALDITVSW